MDVWTKHGPDDKTIVFRKDGDKDVGFMYSAQGRVTTETWGPTPEEYTREQVEEHFTDYLNGPTPEELPEDDEECDSKT
ncbi:MAG TPA: hypothetical protein VGR55_00365 [Candidatus Acidoferrum sp.]|nr:hypothetical protein [Candidatus Acidoferrum sp.]